MNRRYDDTLIGKAAKLWPLILSFIIFVAGYGALAFSVNNHHVIDDKRDMAVQSKLELNCNRLTAIETTLRSLEKHMDSIDKNTEKILRRVH